jgi:hypothetical protein
MADAKDVKNQIKEEMRMATLNQARNAPEPLEEAKESGNMARDEAVAHAAAENLRADEIAAAQGSREHHTRRELEKMTFDELRALANKLGLEECSQLAAKAELVEELLKIS